MTMMEKTPEPIKIKNILFLCQRQIVSPSVDEMFVAAQVGRESTYRNNNSYIDKVKGSG